MFFLSIPLYEPKKSHDLSLNSKISTDKDIESTNTVQGQFTDWHEVKVKDLQVKVKWIIILVYQHPTSLAILHYYN